MQKILMLRLLIQTTTKKNVTVFDFSEKFIDSTFSSFGTQKSISELMDYFQITPNPNFSFILNFRKNNLFSEQSLEIITKFIEHNFHKNLSYVDLSSNRFDISCWTKIIDLLGSSTNFVLDISKNPVSSIDNSSNFQNFTHWNRLIWIPNAKWLAAGHWKKCLNDLQKKR